MITLAEANPGFWDGFHVIWTYAPYILGIGLGLWVLWMIISAFFDL